MAQNNSKTFASWVINGPLNNNSGDYIDWYNTFPNDITNKLDNYFNKFWVDQHKSLIGDNSNLPKTNAFEDDNGMTMQCFVPFASKSDINIVLDPIANSIKIEVDAHQEDKNVEHHMKEISRTSMKRTYFLDKRFDISLTVGNFENSILTLEIPYKKDSQRKTLKIK